MESLSHRLPSDEFSSDSDSDFMDHLDLEELKEENEDFTKEEDDDLIPSVSQWREITHIPLLREDRIIQPRTTLDLTRNYSPYELFETLIGHDLWPLLVQNTNEYAYQTLHTEEMGYYLERHPESRFHRWTVTEKSEMMKFISMLLSMALEQRGSIDGNYSHFLF